jgi:hypothetical protein
MYLRFPPFFSLAHRTAAIFLLFFFLCLFDSSPVFAGDSLIERANALRRTYLDTMESVALTCEEEGLNEEAEKTRSYVLPKAVDRLFVPILPLEVEPDKLPEDATRLQEQWHARCGEIRKGYAAKLYRLAQEAAGEKRGTLAMHLALAALHANPDHEKIRNLLGFEKYHQQWRTRWEIDRLRRGYVDHPRFGWIPEVFVERYEEGRRYYKGEWISAEEEAERRSEIRNGWKIESEHYSILTNHSIEEGVRLRRRLEELYRVWKRLFFQFIASESQLTAMFHGRTASGNLPRHRVVFFRTKEGYVEKLSPAEPNIGITVGIYFSSTRTCYFYDKKDDDIARTLLHEATHQLFHETRNVSPAAGRESNFWIIEGIAMYMESIRKQGSYHILGGFDEEIRLQNARYRLLENDFYIPLRDFTRWGMRTFQRHEDLKKIYTQAAGLTHFLMHYDQGAYRDAVVRLLQQVYRGNDTPASLERWTGTDDETLDGRYREFLRTRGQSTSDGRE